MKLIKGTKQELSLGQYSIDCFLLGDGTKSIGIHSLNKLIGNSIRSTNNDYHLFEVERLNYSCPLVKVLQDNADIVLTVGIKDFIQIILKEALQSHDPAIISLLAALTEVGIEKKEQERLFFKRR